MLIKQGCENNAYRKMNLYSATVADELDRMLLRAVGGFSTSEALTEMAMEQMHFPDAAVFPLQSCFQCQLESPAVTRT